MKYPTKRKATLVFTSKSEGTQTREDKTVYLLPGSPIFNVFGEEYPVYMQDKIEDYKGMRLNDPILCLVNKRGEAVVIGRLEHFIHKRAWAETMQRNFDNPKHAKDIKAKGFGGES